MAINTRVADLSGELASLEAEIFEVDDYTEVDEQMAGCCSTSSTSTSSTSSTSSTF